MDVDLMSEEDYVEEFKNILGCFDFASYINKYTRARSKTCLDHFDVKITHHSAFRDMKAFISK